MLIGMTEQTPRWASRKTAAEHLDVHPATIDRMADRGQITKHKVSEGGTVRYDLNEIDAFVKASAA